MDTAPSTTQANQNPDIARALSQIKARRRDYAKYSEYYDGDQPVMFSKQKMREVFGGLFHTLVVNVCPRVVDTLADRLEVIGFTVEDGDQSAGEEAWKIWQANRLDRRSGEAHTEALKEGDSYVIVWPDNEGIPRIIPQDASLVTVRYSTENPGVIMWAAKCWTEDDNRTYLTLYYPDRLEKYVTRLNNVTEQKSDGTEQKSDGTGYASTPNTSLDAKNFVRREVLDENGNAEPWPLPNDWGAVPVFHFANNAGIGKFGRSELKDVVPLQNFLNKAYNDLAAIMESQAFQQRYATGIEVEIDDATGQPISPFKPGPDKIYASSNEGAKFGQFDAADLTQVIAAIAKLEEQICATSATPMHYFQPMTRPPSGEALKMIEEPLIAKADDRAGSFGNTWEDVMLLALEMAKKPTARLKSIWKDPSPRTEVLDAQTAGAAKAVGLPKQFIWARYFHLTEEEIDQNMKLAQEAEQQAAQNALGAMQSAGTPSAAMMKPLQSNGLPHVAENLATTVRATPPKVGG